MAKNPRYYHTAVHKNILRDRFLFSFRQPGRFRAELEKVKLKLKLTLMQKEKGHE